MKGASDSDGAGGRRIKTRATVEGEAMGFIVVVVDYVELLVGKDCISANHLSVEVLLPINIPWRLPMFQWGINVSRN